MQHVILYFHFSSEYLKMVTELIFKDLLLLAHILTCHLIASRQLLNGSNHFWTAFPSHLPYFWPFSPVLQLWDSGHIMEVCHQEPTLGLLCLSLSHRRAVQVSGPQGSVSDRAMRDPAVPTGFKAGERGQKSSSALLPSSLNGSPLGSLKGSFISLPGNRI